MTTRRGTVLSQVRLHHAVTQLNIVNAFCNEAHLCQSSSSSVVNSEHAFCLLSMDVFLLASNVLNYKTAEDYWCRHCCVSFEFPMLHLVTVYSIQMSLWLLVLENLNLINCGSVDRLSLVGCFSSGAPTQQNGGGPMYGGGRGGQRPADNRFQPY